MIHYNEYDIEWLEGYNEILQHLGWDKITDEEVWDIAREYEKEPSFENILYDETLGLLHYLVSSNYNTLSSSYYVNGRDTHFYINGQEIRTLEDFQAITETEEI